MIRTLCAFMIMLAALVPNENVRYDTAVVTDSYYDYGDDANITYLVTSDGNEWAIYNTIVPIGTECVVKFDTNASDSIYDDAIINITFDCEI